MFNEKSSKWIRIFKVITIALFFCFIIAGLLLGLDDGYCVFDFELCNVEIVGSEFGCLMVWLLIGIAAAFIQLVVNMLIIQLLNNVQTIREKLEKE